MIPSTLAEEVPTWISLSRMEIVERLSHVIAELAGLYQEAAVVEAEEVKARANGFAAAIGLESITARDRAAREASLPASMALLELRGNIAALESVREFGYMMVRL